MSNVVETYQPDQVSVVVQVEIEKGAVTTQENAVTTQENSLTTQENTVTTQESVVTNEKNIANEILVLIKETPEITLGGIAEKIGISRDGVKYHIERLKRSVGLIHEGATKKGRWVVVTG